MKQKYLILFLILISFLSFSQDGFLINIDKKQLKIPFRLVNNLIIVPIEINGVTLDFLLDTGVEQTILFSLENETSIEFKDVEKIKIKGLGSGEAIDAYHTRKNLVKIGKYEDKNHEIYIILDQDINFSAQLGIPVYGIIGSDFFKNDIVEVNYSSKNIFVYHRDSKKIKQKLLKYEKIPISIELEKPYVLGEIFLNNYKMQVKLLIDSGGSDAIWLFQNTEKVKVPEPNFQDYLGKGFSGDIFGKRSRIESIQFGKYIISKPTASFPESNAYQSVSLVEGRNGSVGSEILKRFNIIFDYMNSAIYIKKNSNFEEPFNYNMSGLEIEHYGMQMVEEQVELKTNLVTNGISVYDDKSSNIKYKFALKPLFVITNVRELSPGEAAGFKKNDKLIKINGTEAYKYRLDEITALLQSEEGRWITIEVERAGKIIKSKFQLKKIL
ncbi:MAG: aspartyl protease family protein [Limnohabitans sp.]|nr:aspartyl protease family protein [Limnohabitans sp.]